MEFSVCSDQLRRNKTLHIDLPYLLYFAFHLRNAFMSVTQNVHVLVLVMESWTHVTQHLTLDCRLTKTFNQ